MKKEFVSRAFIFGVVIAASGCASSRVHLPPTNSFYTVSAEGSGAMTEVGTVEFMGDWVLLDGRRLIPKERIQFIRADRERPALTARPTQ